jgi:hypothetical protein
MMMELIGVKFNLTFSLDWSEKPPPLQRGGTERVEGVRQLPQLRPRFQFKLLLLLFIELLSPYLGRRALSQGYYRC